MGNKGITQSCPTENVTNGAGVWISLILASVSGNAARSLGAMLLVLLAGCATGQAAVHRIASHALADSSQTALGRAFAPQIAEHPGQSGFQILDRGEDAFLSRVALADAAERTLDLQYYIASPGLTTDFLLRSLIKAAQRGVRVRILLDDVNEANRTFAADAAAAHRGIEVRLFNPFLVGGSTRVGRFLEFASDGERLNRRMHNKLWIADNTAGLIGGRNLGDDYFGANPEVNFNDLDLLAVGPVVRELSQGFDKYWNSGSAVPFVGLAIAMPSRKDAVRVNAAIEARLASVGDTDYGRMLAQGATPKLVSMDRQLIWGLARASHDDPDKPEIVITTGMQEFLPQIGATFPDAKSELLIMSPYFIPSDEGRTHLGDMRRRGVRVAVLTNSLASTDAIAAHAGYARYRADLLRRGVELFELRPEPGVRHSIRHRWRGSSSAALHAKLVIIDRSKVLLGSMNLDPRSRMHNTEAWISVESHELASRLAELVDESTEPEHSFQLSLAATPQNTESITWTTEEEGRTVIYESEPMTSGWVRLWRSLLSVLVPEHML